MIITNNCLGGYIYKYNKLQYDNPFIWTRLYIMSFANLINYYDKTNFEDFEILLNDDLIDTHKPYIREHQCSISLKNNIRILYNHIKYDACAITPIVKRFNEFTGDIFCRYTYKCVFDTYVRRLQRFDKNEKPLFVFMHDAPQFDDSGVLTLLNTVENNSYKMIFFTEDEKYRYLKLNNTLIVNVDKNNFNQLYIAKTYNNLFKNYLHYECNQ